MRIYITISISTIIFLIPILIVGLKKTIKYRPTADKAIEIIFKEFRK